MSFRVRAAAAGAVAATALSLTVPMRARQAPTIDVSVFHDLAWRSVGPFRGGRTTAVAGVPGGHRVFYIGVEDGGVWKTTDAGGTWRPIFDNQDAGEIGAIAVAPSDSRTIYVGGTGGLFRSADAGATWTRLNLSAGNAIPAIVVASDNPRTMLVAVLGHRDGANAERGVFRSTDGGQSFDRVLFADENTGASSVIVDPDHPATIYAVEEASRLSPWDSVTYHGAGTGIFRSTDGGATWHAIGRGLPTFAADGVEHIAIAIARSNAARLFAVATARTGSGVYRSDDGGDTWEPTAGLGMPVSDAPTDVAVDPANAAVIYTVGAALEKSADAGRSFRLVRPAQATALWIDPADSGVQIVAGDRGASVTLNGGETWSSTDTQPTSDIAKISIDDAFPYAVCGGDETAPAICLPSRGLDGVVGSRDWQPTGADEGATVASDPSSTETTYTAGRSGVAKFERQSGGRADLTPLHRQEYRTAALPPLLFLPGGRTTLLFGANTLWKLDVGTAAWTESSPDLARTTGDLPAAIGIYREHATAADVPRGAIAVIRPSPVDPRAIWIGTDDGEIDVSGDSAATWANVTPAIIAPWARVSSIEASHFDFRTAYAAVNAERLDDRRPHVLRTRDGGATWTPITLGLPGDVPVNAIVEDPFRRGLLFAGTDRSVYVSFDDGDAWQPLTLNLPPISVRDLAIKDDDLIVATHGRGLWVLDDYAPLRQITADITGTSAFLFRPTTAWRLRPALWTRDTDTDAAPVARNPVDGVGIDYELGPGAEGPVTLEIVNGPTGEVLRHYSSDVDPGLSTAPGLHRFVWDLHVAPMESRDLGDDERSSGRSIGPRGVLVLPGVYQVRMAVGGLVMRQAVIVRLDPAVHASSSDLEQQFALAKSVDGAIAALSRARAVLRDRAAGGGSGANSTAAADLETSAAALAVVLDNVERADGRPTPAIEAAANTAIRGANALIDAATH